MTGPRNVLAELDAAVAAATPGPWHVAKSGAIDAGRYDTVIGGGPVDCMSRCYGGSSTIEGDNLPADAALIVAAVNTLPALVAAVRGVLDLADQARYRGVPVVGIDELDAALTHLAGDHTTGEPS